MRVLKTAMSSHLERIQQMVNACGTGAASSSPYNMGWLLRSRVLALSDQERLKQQLLAEQHADGSWGSSYPYVYDRVINTLGVAVSLSELGQEREAVERGVQYLRGALPRLQEEAVETIGFELIFPSLMETAKARGLELPYQYGDVVQELSRKKKALIPPGIFARATSVSFSLEAFEEYGDVALFPNGSVGNSPSATAAYLMRRGKREDSMRYLEQFSERNWRVPSVYPFEVFEKAWMLYNLLHAGLLPRLDIRRITDALWAHLCQFNGASISDSCPVIDSDDTAMVYIVLKETGYPVSMAVLEQFEQAQWFRCFDLERNPSLSANIHILEAVRRTPEYPRQSAVIDKIVAFLRKAMRPDGTWLDKWHVSPYYCTGHAVLALGDLDAELTARALAYILETQRSDGGWGVLGSSVEETAYALQALSSRPESENLRAAIERGRSFIQKNYQQEPPALWVAKDLYAPLEVLESAAIVWRE